MREIRALIVDDEPPARRGLRLLAAKQPDVIIAGEARNGLEAVRAMDASAFDLVFLDAWKDDYELLFAFAREKLDPGGVVVADNVTTSDTVQAYAAARQADPTLVSVTVPVGHGLEVTTVLAP